jgi:hypothetical protein
MAIPWTILAVCVLLICVSILALYMRRVLSKKRQPAHHAGHLGPQAGNTEAQPTADLDLVRRGFLVDTETFKTL